MPVSSAPKPLPSGAGLTTPDSETVVVSARIGEFSAPGGGRPKQQFRARGRVGSLQPLGALRLRKASSPEPSFFTVAASAPTPSRVFIRNTDLRFSPPQASSQVSSDATPQASSDASFPVSPQTSIPAQSPSWLSSIGGSLPAPAVRVSEEAAGAGRIPVAARHSLAQVRPSDRRAQDETAPVLDDPVLYRYSGLLNDAREQATPPRIVVN